MTVSAKMIAYSTSPDGFRLPTLQLRYPKFIHGEAKTHRVLRMNDAWVDLMEEVGLMDDPNLSRNASSSRAIPIERIIQDILRDPAIPSFAAANKPGMQGGDLLSPHEIDALRCEWLDGMHDAIKRARRMASMRGAKQDVNRILEPWSHINVVVTATEWSNFLALRRHPDAQPEAQMLANAIYRELTENEPVLLHHGQWHLPYITAQDLEQFGLYTWVELWKRDDVVDKLVKVSVARCARVSYLTHDGRQTSLEEDLALHEKLAGQAPLHASPAEHQALPDVRLTGGKWASPQYHGNLKGWQQYRKMLPHENAQYDW